MVFYQKKDYKFIRFKKSTKKIKKYMAVLQNKHTNRLVHVHFGDSRYGQFKDRTPLKLYSHLDHNDKKRKSNYIRRHSKDINKPYSASWFSLKYLW